MIPKSTTIFAGIFFFSFSYVSLIYLMISSSYQVWSDSTCRNSFKRRKQRCPYSWLRYSLELEGWSSQSGLVWLERWRHINKSTFTRTGRNNTNFFFRTHKSCSRNHRSKNQYQKQIDFSLHTHIKSSPIVFIPDPDQYRVCLLFFPEFPLLFSPLFVSSSLHPLPRIHRPFISHSLRLHPISPPFTLLHLPILSRSLRVKCSNFLCFDPSSDPQPSLIPGIGVCSSTSPVIPDRDCP